MNAIEQLARARDTIAALRTRLGEVRATSSEAIAVIGMACRFPGEARDCEGYWHMIAAGKDAIRPIPPQRAQDMAADRLRPAALLDNIDMFDAAFFDISPREAIQMDPQQRLFLEVAWEALEDAGQTRSSLAASSTGVFVGIHNHSNGYLELQTSEASNLNEYTAIGTAHDVIGGRLAYILDLRGPCVVINTACSSSLVAVHLACQSILSRDCRLALAGGANLILGPSQDRIVGLGAMLAPDGRCKTFDARANGYGRGEGCGVVVLKRLSEALTDRDRVLAVVLGSAVNQDGRTNGLTAPNGLSQQALLRRALARAGLEPSRVGYVEAHGTGTALGDPIEVEALAAVYGGVQDGGSRCALGSAKSNINHLEGAAGIAGLIKAILGLNARLIPPVAGLEDLNPHLSLQATRLFVPTEAIDWRSDVPRVAGVSAFGWSGVNAHVLLEEGPAAPTGAAGRPTVIVVSASDRSALSARASALADALESQPDDLVESFAFTATARRTPYASRLAVVGANRSELTDLLRGAGRREPIVVRDPLPTVGFLIGDQTEVAVSLGSELIAEEEAFRDAVAGCSAAFAENAATPATLGARFAAQSDRVQTFAFCVGTAAVLQAWGIQPAAIAGWAQGTVIASYLGGDLSLSDALRRLAEGPFDAQPARAAAQLATAGVTHTVRLDRLSWGRALAAWAPALCATPATADCGRPRCGGRGDRLERGIWFGSTRCEPAGAPL